MSKHRRNWSVEEKEKIVLFSIEYGVTKASREYEVSTVSIYKWEKIRATRHEWLSTCSTTDLERDLKKLRRENLALKRIIADKEQAIQVKDYL